MRNSKYWQHLEQWLAHSKHNVLLFIQFHSKNTDVPRSRFLQKRNLSSSLPIHKGYVERDKSSGSWPRAQLRVLRAWEWLGHPRTILKVLGTQRNQPRGESCTSHMDKEGLWTHDGDLQRTKLCPFDPLVKIKDPLGLGLLLSLGLGRDLPYIPPTSKGPVSPMDDQTFVHDE